MKRSSTPKQKRTYLVRMNSEGYPLLDKKDLILIELDIAEKVQALGSKEKSTSRRTCQRIVDDVACRSNLRTEEFKKSC